MEKKIKLVMGQIAKMMAAELPGVLAEQMGRNAPRMAKGGETTIAITVEGMHRDKITGVDTQVCHAVGEVVVEADVWK